MNTKIGNPEQVCMAQRVQVTEGRGNGARQIYVANGNELSISQLLCRSRCAWAKHEMPRMLDGELKYSVLKPGRSVAHTLILKAENI